MNAITKTTLVVLLAVHSGALNARGGECRDQGVNDLMRRMGPIGSTAMCPGWEKARQEYNVRRDVPSVPVPKAEYRYRVRLTERR